MKLARVCRSSYVPVFFRLNRAGHVASKGGSAEIGTQDNLAGVNVEINAVLIMQTLFGFELGNYYRSVLLPFRRVFAVAPADAM